MKELYGGRYLVAVSPLSLRETPSPEIAVVALHDLPPEAVLYVSGTRVTAQQGYSERLLFFDRVDAGGRNAYLIEIRWPGGGIVSTWKKQFEMAPGKVVNIAYAP